MRVARGLLAITSILLALASPAVYGANTCQALFGHETNLVGFDARYGRASQIDPQLRAAGLIDQYGSQLCGPTCVYNALLKFRAVAKNQKSSPIVSATEITGIVQRVFGRLAVDVVHKGSKENDVASALRDIFAEEQIGAVVESYSASHNETGVKSGLNFDALLSAAADNKVVIVGLGSYRTETAERASRSNRAGGHFMILAGHNTATKEFYFIDPLTPRQIRLARMERVQPEMFPHATLQLRFEDGAYANRVVLMDSMIVGTLTN